MPIADCGYQAEYSLFMADNTVFGVITNQRGCKIITGTTVKKGGQLQHQGHRQIDQ
jgi:ribosome-associated protein YbcJ (S4-like RNA binding protein)